MYEMCGQPEQVDNLLLCGGVSPRRPAQGLSQGRVDDVDLPLEAGEERLRAAPARPEEPGGVALVDEGERVVLLGQGADVGERRHVAVHGEDAVRDDQASPRVGRGGQLRFELCGRRKAVTRLHDALVYHF